VCPFLPKSVQVNLQDSDWLTSISASPPPVHIVRVIAKHFKTH
jgi:hypothetical protein